MTALTDKSTRRERVAYRLARGVLADVLGELGVVQDDTTAVGVLTKAADVEYRTRSKHGEVIVITLQLDDAPTDDDSGDQAGDV